MSDSRTVPVCYRHPDRTTYLSCSECGRPICPDCSHDAPVGQKCPECARPTGRHRVVNARAITQGPSFETSPVVFSLIAINVAIFLIGLTSHQLQNQLIADFGAYTPAIQAGEWWRALTAAFLHGGFLHILFNMYFLYLFGPRLEQQIGSVSFAGIYFASAAGGSLATYAFGPANSLSIGASGALFGLFGAWMYAAFRQRGSAAGRSMFNQLGLILLINMALPLYLPEIDWRAHLGGLTTGIVIAYLWEQLASGKQNARTLRSIISYVVFAVAMAMILIV